MQTMSFGKLQLCIINLHSEGAATRGHSVGGLRPTDVGPLVHSLGWGATLWGYAPRISTPGISD